jgi:hypothetical protein
VDQDGDLDLLNPSTGAIESTVGHMGIHIYGLKFDSNGVLYGYNGGALYQVNPLTASETLISLSTGAATLVGVVGYDVTTMIYEGTTLYGFTYQANSEVISINTSTGAGSFLYNTSGAGTITSLTDIPTAASVPEPSTAVLAAIACVTGITANGWRRRKAKLA